MLMRLGFLLVLVGVAAASVDAAEPVCRCEFATKQALATSGQASVDDLVAKVREAGAPNMRELRVRVETTPWLIFYRGGVITIPWWAELTKDKPFFLHVGGDEARAQHLFNVLFQQFLLAHEAGHAVQDHLHALAKPSLYEQEVVANRYAAAYWMTTRDGEAHLQEVLRLSKAALSRVPNPVPAGRTAQEYFNREYETIGSQPLIYGWFQFQFIIDAIEQSKRPTLAELIAADIERHAPWP